MLFTHCSEISDMAHGVLSLPWFLISSWICKFCMFTSPSTEVTLGSLSKHPWESAAFVDSPYQERNHPRKLLSSLFFHHHQLIPDLPPPSLVALMCSYFKGTKIPCHICLALLVQSHQQCCLKSGGILGDTGGVWGVPVCPQRVLVRKSLSRVVQSPLCAFNLRLGKENPLLLWGRTELAFNADPLQISCRYPKHWKEQIPLQLKPSVSDNTTDLLLCYYQPAHN